MKILYFYPENPLHKSQGNNARALELLHYFKDRKIEIDFVGVASRSFSENEITKLKEEKLISNGYLLPQFKRSKNQLKYFLNYSLPDKLGKRIGELDRTRLGHLEAFDAILKENEYDHIIISYAYWGKLIEDNENVKNANLIIDTHDFLTSQFQDKKRFKLGEFFQKEIAILNQFDKILVVSIEEQYLFAQFTEKRIEIVTHILPQKMSLKTEAIYDLVYVASDNEHNVKSVRWFFDFVYPMLSKTIKIVVVGKIVTHINNYDNVQKFNFVEDLDSIYAQSKIAICPMLSGTGLKIKVVEAMSFGLPIVCNERGVDGLLNKINNGCLVTNNPNEFANYIHKLIKDEIFYNIQSENAKEFFKENHSKETTYTKLDEVFKL